MKLDYVSARGEKLPLVGNPLFLITNVDGMTRATTSLSSVVVGGLDGDEINNAQAQPRSIIIDLQIRDDVNVEDAKRAVLQVIKIKQHGSLVWEQNNKTLTITGVVESVEMPRFANGVVMQIALHCEQPFWEDIDFIVQQIDEAIGLHYFTYTVGDMLYFPAQGLPFGEFDVSRTRHIHNVGDVAVGLEIEILAYSTVTNPIIYDTDGNFFGVGYGDGIKQVVMHEGDIIRVTTHKGKKSVTMNGTSILGRIKPNSTWLQMQAGDNTFSVDSEEDEINNMTFSLIFKQRYI